MNATLAFAALVLCVDGFGLRLAVQRSDRAARAELDEYLEWALQDAGLEITHGRVRVGAGRP